MKGRVDDVQEGSAVVFVEGGNSGGWTRVRVCIAIVGLAFFVEKEWTCIVALERPPVVLSAPIVGLYVNMSTLLNCLHTSVVRKECTLLQFHHDSLRYQLR